MVKQRKKIHQAPLKEGEEVIIKYPAKVMYDGQIVGIMNRNGVIDFFEYRMGFKIMEKLKDEGWGVKKTDEKGNPINYFRIARLVGEDEKMLKKKVQKSSIFGDNSNDISKLTNSSGNPLTQKTYIPFSF